MSGTDDRSDPKTDVKTGPDEVDNRPPWRKTIHPYLTKLAERINRDGVKDHSISLPMGPNRVLLSPREQRLMLTFSGNVEKFGDQEGMLVDSLGLQISMFVSLRTLAKNDALNAGRHKTRLARERDFAYLLSREITVAMRRERDCGDRDEAEALQESRRHLHKAIVEVENVLGTELPASTKTAKNRQFVYDWEAINSLPAPPPPDLTPQSIDVEDAQQKSTPVDRTFRLRIVLAVLSLVLLAVLFNLWNSRQRQLKDFTVADFKEVPGIEQVVNRSPMLLIVVDEAEWNRHNSFEKIRAIKAVGTLARTAGYQTAEFRSVKTPYLAMWHRSGKIEFSD